MYYTNNGTYLYQGDMVVGDREATTKEVEAYEDKKDLYIKVQEAQSYLDNTDWITGKYNDVVTVLGTMSKTDFVAKYKEIYDNRTAARAIVGGE